MLPITEDGDDVSLVPGDGTPAVRASKALFDSCWLGQLLRYGDAPPDLILLPDFSGAAVAAAVDALNGGKPDEAGGLADADTDLLVCLGLRDPEKKKYEGPQGDGETTPVSTDDMSKTRPSLVVMRLGGVHWNCILCGLAVVGANKKLVVQEMLAHIDLAHFGGGEQDVKPWVCHDCGLAFPTEDKLESHRDEMHVFETRPPAKKRRRKEVSYVNDLSKSVIETMEADDPDMKTANSNKLPPGFNPSDDEDGADKDFSEAMLKDERWEANSSDTDDDDKDSKARKRAKRPSPSPASSSKSAPLPATAPGPRPSPSTSAPTPPPGTPRTATASVSVPTTPAGTPSAASRARKCILCGGRGGGGRGGGQGGTDGNSIDFLNNFKGSAYHYAICLYDTEKYYRFVEVGDDNADPDGRPRDHVANEITYSCPDCEKQKRPWGYKEYFIHRATDHGLLGEVLRAHADEADDPTPAESVRARYLDGWRAFKGEAAEEGESPSPQSSPGCRAGGCNFTAETSDELKRHYSLRHYHSHFTEVLPGAMRPKVPMAADPDRGVPCKLCPREEGKKNKMARICGTRDDVLVHLAVVHDKLYSALRDAASRRGDRVADMAIKDLYPDKLA